MAKSVGFSSSPVTQPTFRASLPTRSINHKVSFKLHAASSFFNFPLASKIMVRNLSYATCESCLEKQFSNFGNIAEVKLVKDETTKKSKGYAFIQYNSQDDALRALESMDEQYFDGRVIFVELAKPRKHVYGGYPKSSGPPAKGENSLPQADEEYNILDQDGLAE
ncbi:hypothetical protein LguiA_024805 [Lonicera macranthoides]